MKRARTSLFVSLIILAVGTNGLLLKTWKSPLSFLNGRWVLDTVEYQGMITQQQPDSLDLFLLRLWLLPEEYDLPINVYAKAFFMHFNRTTIQFSRVYKFYEDTYEMYPIPGTPILADSAQSWEIVLHNKSWINPDDRRPIRLRMEINSHGFCLITDNLSGDKRPVVTSSDRTFVLSFVRMT